MQLLQYYPALQSCLWKAEQKHNLSGCTDSHQGPPYPSILLHMQTPKEESARGKTLLLSPSQPPAFSISADILSLWWFVYCLQCLDFSLKYLPSPPCKPPNLSHILWQGVPCVSHLLHEDRSSYVCSEMVSYWLYLIAKSSDTGRNRE